MIRTSSMPASTRLAVLASAASISSRIVWPANGVRFAEAAAHVPLRFVAEPTRWNTTLVVVPMTLTFNQYLAHGSNATSADFLRVSVVGTTTSVVFQRVGAAANLNGAWAAASANLTPFAGQTIRLLIEAADAATASLVEAGIDDVRITQQ